MKRSSVLLVFAAVLCAGCVHSTTRGRGGLAALSGGPEGHEAPIVVNVFADGRLELFGRPYEREALVARLLDEEGSTGGRHMIVLSGHDGVPVARLAALQDYLVSRRLYRVSIETPRVASSSGTAFEPILPAGGLDAQDLSPDDPLVLRYLGE